MRQPDSDAHATLPILRRMLAISERVIPPERYEKKYQHVIRFQKRRMWMWIIFCAIIIIALINRTEKNDGAGVIFFVGPMLLMLFFFSHFIDRPSKRSFDIYNLYKKNLKILQQAFKKNGLDWPHTCDVNPRTASNLAYTDLSKGTIDALNCQMLDLLDAEAGIEKPNKKSVITRKESKKAEKEIAKARSTFAITFEAGKLFRLMPQSIGWEPFTQANTIEKLPEFPPVVEIQLIDDDILLLTPRVQTPDPKIGHILLTRAIRTGWLQEYVPPEFSTDPEQGRVPA